MKKNRKYTSIVIATLLAITPIVDSIIPETSMTENTVLAATKSKKKVHTSKKTKKVKKKKTKKSQKSKKAKKISTSTIYKELFGKKSSDSTIEKYRNKIIKVAKKYVKLNGGLNPAYIKYMFYFKANNKNSTIYDFDDEDDFPSLEVGEKASDDPVEEPQYLIDDDSTDDSIPESQVDVQKFKGKYYYVDTDDDEFYPVNQWKPALKKFG